MLWNRKIILGWMLLLTACGKSTANATLDICPKIVGADLRYIDVFDGTPEEMATLVPDKEGETSGYWRLDYVYDAGRFVTVRCKYSNGEKRDIKLAQKIKQCDYVQDKNQKLKISCQ